MSRQGLEPIGLHTNIKSVIINIVMQDNMEDQNVSVTVMVLILILVLLAGAVWYGSQHDMFGFVPTQNEAAKDEKPVEEEKKVEEVVESTEPTESTESSPSSPNVTLDVNNEISDDIKSALAKKLNAMNA